MNHPNHTIELIVFDLDGTLVDSKKDIAIAVNLTLSQFGFPQLTEEEIGKHVGTGVWPLIAKTMKDLDSVEVNKAFSAFTQNYLEHLVDNTLLYKGMLEVLTHYESVKKVILTNKLNIFVEPLLRALDLKHYFVGTYGRDSFPTYKPDPLPLLEISKIHQVPLNKILMIGDTEADILAGQRAGTQTCAALYGFGDKNSVLNLKPSFYIDKPSDLILRLKAQADE